MRERTVAQGREWIAWSGLCGIVLAVILIPFALFGSQIEAWTGTFIAEAGRYGLWVPVVIAGLLAADIVLPVPSSIISTAAGLLLGFAGGMLASLCGMTLGSVVGYALGARARGPLESRWFSPESIERFEKLADRTGEWGIIIARPVPVLAEASVFFAGMSRMPLRRFLPLTLLSNLGFSAAYAAVGAFAAGVDSFLLAFAGAILLPMIGMIVLRRRKSAVGS